MSHYSLDSQGNIVRPDGTTSLVRKRSFTAEDKGRYGMDAVAHFYAETSDGGEVDAASPEALVDAMAQAEAPQAKAQDDSSKSKSKGK